MPVTIRMAEARDTEEITRIPGQIARIHNNGRPDLFKAENQKCGREEFLAALKDENKPVFVAVDGSDKVIGYVFKKLFDTDPMRSR